VIDDSVSTQSDLKPSENKNYMIKIAMAVVIIIIALIFLIVYRKWWITIFILVPGIYIAMQATPAENICVNAGAPVYLLPIENATVFEQVSAQGTFEVKHSVEGYRQITYNNKIGWVNEDDICSH
jgi:vancomycin permeability regulator SanA